MGDVKVVSINDTQHSVTAISVASTPTAVEMAASPETREVEHSENTRESEPGAISQATSVAAVDLHACVHAIETATEQETSQSMDVQAPVQTAVAGESHVECNCVVDKAVGETEKIASDIVETATPARADAIKEHVSLANGSMEEAPAEETQYNAENDGVAFPVAVAVAAHPAESNKKRPRSPCVNDHIEQTPTTSSKQNDEEDVAAITSVEEQSPEVICLDGDTAEEEEEDGEDVDLREQDGTEEPEPLGSELSAVDETHESVGDRQHTPLRRRRKRARVMGFSNNRRSNSLAKQKRQSELLSIVATNGCSDDPHDVVVAPPNRVRRQQSADANTSMEKAAASADAVPPHHASSSAEVATWEWDSSRVYFDPLAQFNMDDLAKLRRDNAQVVVANGHAWGKMRRFENDETCLASMLADAGETDDVEHLRIRAASRGRSYRDVWEEEDFLHSQRKPTASGRSASKKRPFAGCEGVSSYRQLVRGYDDELFGKYMERLEARALQKTTTVEHHETNGSSTMAPSQRIEGSPPRRLKVAKRPAKDLESLPPVPSAVMHPASCGSWKLKGKEITSYEAIHPAASRSAWAPQRWVEEMARVTKSQHQGEEEEEDRESSVRPRRSGRREASKQDVEDDADDCGDDSTADEDEQPSDELVELPSFGVVVDEDEVSKEIDNSVMRLVELSALNWRRAHALYEQAVTSIEVAPLVQGEEVMKQRLESVYRKLFPPVVGDYDDMDDPPVRDLKLTSTPKHLVAFATKPCSDVHESLAVAASVEYAVRLKKGDAIDVLDRNGCWNDGVVIDLFMEAGRGLKYVLVSYALWGDDSAEWVSVTDGRLLPRGVADGRVTFSVVSSMARKRRVELNKKLADLLQRTYPTRQAAREAGRTKVEDGAENGKPPGKKQRRQHRP